MAKGKKKSTKDKEVKNDAQKDVTMNKTEKEQVQEDKNDNISDIAEELIDQEKEDLKAECEDKTDEITLVKKAYDELNDKHIRLQAEFDNYRKRTLREKMEMTKSAGESILVNILPVIDDFERAQDILTDASDIDSVRQGIDLIYAKFLNFLKQNGVSAIDTVENEFDTDLHEAITKIPAPKEELKGKVVDCIQKGYKLNDKVIRFAKVVVGE